MIKVTIAIPTYNQEKTIEDSLKSALAQEYPHKEILVIDDGSTDKTVEICKRYPVRVIVNEKNIGIGKNLAKLMSEAKGRYVVYLCGDDVFTSTKVVNDIVTIFDRGEPGVGIIGRYYFQFMNGYPGAIMVCRDHNIITQSCNPSGMAFRKTEVVGSNKIFIEMPTIVAQCLKHWRWTMIEYDTIAARIHPGGNTATKKWYYTESPIVNWTSLCGKDHKFHQGMIQLRNRAPHLLPREVYNIIKINPKNLLDPYFWLYAVIACTIPGWILRPLSNFYRHRITRRKCKIIERNFA